TAAVAAAPPVAASAITAPARPATPLPAAPTPIPTPSPAPVVVAAPKPVAAPVEPATELSVVTGASILARLPVIAKDVPESPIGAILAGQSGLSLVRSLSLAQQDPAYQAALRDLAAGLMPEVTPAACRKILVTAPGAGEGKTFLTLALAQHLAIAGRRVLAVECDLRTPRFEAALALVGGRGLQAVLLGDAQPRDVVVRTATPNLDVIAAGPASSQFELLRRKQLSDLLLWSQSYDVVLVDGPIPAVLMDVGVLARQVDGVLLSMRTGSFSIGEAVATTSAIKAAGGKVLGIAMTMMKPDASARPAEPAVDAYLRAT
ncbi:MAG TPA: CpsD/CapB family tyrosine-protein kinase, partial [Tardiphaga sp.]